jgi:NADPH-dependent 2,4-dienoyl-CoA reductase/sulfur reductase-like enzyme
VAGGATCAARARRLNEFSSIMMFEKGKNISIASCGLPYHIGGEIKDRDRLVLSNPDHLRKTLNVDVRVGHEVVKIDRANKTIQVNNLFFPTGSPGSTFDVPYDKLLLATGASPIVPSLSGYKKFFNKGQILTLRSLEDMDSIINRIKKAGRGGHIVVVGAGFIGLEVVEALSQVGMAVTLIENRESVLPLLDPEMTRPLATEMTIKGVRVLVSKRVVGFGDHENQNLLNIELESGERIAADTVLLSIGVSPDSQLAEQAGLGIDKRKAIIVNEYMQTSDQDIYAVGDVVSTPYCVSPRQTYLPLGGPANRMARIAADHMFLGDSKTEPYRGSFGTSIVRVFDSVAGKTGLSENGNSISYPSFFYLLF